MLLNHSLGKIASTYINNPAPNTQSSRAWRFVVQGGLSYRHL
jgi:hypothetical protein